MRFSCISAPQRKLSSSLTSILPSQTTSPPGRTASTVVRNAAALPAASITASAPRPPLSCLAAAATSSRLAFTPRVAPMRRARSSLPSSMSTAMIFAAPASLAPCTAASPTAPQPITITVSACPIWATLSAAPTPVITPQPIRQARSNGMSGGTMIACCSCTMQYSPKAPMNIKCLSSSPLAPRLRGAVELHRLRALAEIILAQDREPAVAIVAVAAMRVPRQDDVIALFQPPHGGTHLLDHACGFMTEHDRHRIAQRAVDHFEVGVTKPRGVHAHQHVRWRDRRGGDRLDLQRAVRTMQHGRPGVEGHGRAEAISYFT